MRCEAPSAYITAYKLKYSQLRAFTDGYLNILAPTNINRRRASDKPGLDFYRGLYATNTDPITRLNLPFFGDNVRAFTSEFQDTFTPVSQRGAKMLGAEFIEGLAGMGERMLGGGTELISGVAQSVAGLGGKSLIDKIAKSSSMVMKGMAGVMDLDFGARQNDLQTRRSNPGMQTIGAPGTYIETPKFYQYSNTDTGLEISFALSNTINDDAIEQNYKFIKDFTRMNRPFRTGAIGMTFPAIYSLVIPGLRYIQWANLENFSIDLIGSRRRLRNPNGSGSRVIPEAYACSFKFKSLTTEAANFMDELEQFGSFGGCDGASRDSYLQLKKEEERLMADMAAFTDAAAARRSGRIPMFVPGVVGSTEWQQGMAAKLIEIDPEGRGLSDAELKAVLEAGGFVDPAGLDPDSGFWEVEDPDKYGPNATDFWRGIDPRRWHRERGVPGTHEMEGVTGWEDQGMDAPEGYWWDEGAGEWRHENRTPEFPEGEGPLIRLPDGTLSRDRNLEETLEHIDDTVMDEDMSLRDKLEELFPRGEERQREREEKLRKKAEAEKRNRELDVLEGVHAEELEDPGGA